MLKFKGKKIYLEEIPTLKLPTKLAKLDFIKLVLKFIFDSDKSRQNRNNLHKFKGFEFQIDDVNFEAKLSEVLEKFNKTELVLIANFLQTEIKEIRKRNCT